MKLELHSRRIVRPAFATLLLSAATVAFAVQPASLRKAGQARPAMNAPRQGQGQKPKQEHLGQWMDRHSNLPLADQQKALESEPGFKDLPPQTQQAMRNRLTQLNNMTPEQRRRVIEHTEVMEHLTPQQRQEVRWRSSRDFLKTVAAWSHAPSGTCERCHNRNDRQSLARTGSTGSFLIRSEAQSPIC
jgi:hypothetical protein